jgi:hypothetical protein
MVADASGVQPGMIETLSKVGVGPKVSTEFINDSSVGVFDILESSSKGSAVDAGKFASSGDRQADKIRSVPAANSVLTLGRKEPLISDTFPSSSISRDSDWEFCECTKERKRLSTMVTVMCVDIDLGRIAAIFD